MISIERMVQQYGFVLGPILLHSPLYQDLAKEPKPGSGMTDDESGIGLDGNTVNQVDKDAPPFKPTIVDDEGNVIENPDADEEA